MSMVVDSETEGCAVIYIWSHRAASTERSKFNIYYGYVPGSTQPHRTLQ